MDDRSWLTTSVLIVLFLIFLVFMIVMSILLLPFILFSEDDYYHTHRGWNNYV